jgi:hypothetical protein
LSARRLRRLVSTLGLRPRLSARYALKGFAFS